MSIGIEITLVNWLHAFKCLLFPLTVCGNLSQRVPPYLNGPRRRFCSPKISTVAATWGYHPFFTDKTATYDPHLASMVANPLATTYSFQTCPPRQDHFLYFSLSYNTFLLRACVPRTLDKRKNLFHQYGEIICNPIYIWWSISPGLPPFFYV